MIQAKEIGPVAMAGGAQFCFFRPHFSFDSLFCGIKTKIQLFWNVHPQNHNSRLPALEKAAHLLGSISLLRCELFRHFSGWRGPLITDIWRLRLSCVSCAQWFQLPRYGWPN
jgi:hypothetical protein